VPFKFNLRHYNEASNDAAAAWPSVVAPPTRGGGGGRGGGLVGLYKLNPFVTHSLQSPAFNPW
jgi:hypothetical protein